MRLPPTPHAKATRRLVTHPRAVGRKSVVGDPSPSGCLHPGRAWSSPGLPGVDREPDRRARRRALHPLSGFCSHTFTTHPRRLESRNHQYEPTVRLSDDTVLSYVPENPKINPWFINRRIRHSLNQCHFLFGDIVAYPWPSSVNNPGAGRGDDGNASWFFLSPLRGREVGANAPPRSVAVVVFLVVTRSFRSRLGRTSLLPAREASVIFNTPPGARGGGLYHTGSSIILYRYRICFQTAQLWPRHLGV